MQIKPCYGIGVTLGTASVGARALSDARADAPMVAAMFKALAPMVKIAGRKDLHFYVDPQLAENFNVNLHLINTQAGDATDDERIVQADKKSDFIEETVSMPSKRPSDGPSARPCFCY